MVVKGKIRKKYIALRFSSFCLSQDYKQCTLATNDYHIVYSHIILNMSTFLRLWTNQFWAQYAGNKPNFADYSLPKNIQGSNIHSFNTLAEEF